MIIRKADKTERFVKNVRGGEGDIIFNDIVLENLLPENLMLCSVITIKQGDSVGKHNHHGESEVFYCLSGQGYVFDQGREVTFFEGDTLLTLYGEYHSIRNENEADLVIVALIISV